MDTEASDTVVSCGGEKNGTDEQGGLAVQRSIFSTIRLQIYANTMLCWYITKTVHQLTPSSDTASHDKSNHQSKAQVIQLQLRQVCTLKHQARE